MQANPWIAGELLSGVLFLFFSYKQLSIAILTFEKLCKRERDERAKLPTGLGQVQ